MTPAPLPRPSVPGPPRRVRAAGAGDVTGVAALEVVLFGAEAWTAAQVAEELDGPGRRAWVIDRPGGPPDGPPDGPADDRAGDPADDPGAGVAAYAVTMTLGEVTDLLRIGVALELRRAGLARMLLVTALEAARADGAERVLLEVAAGNAGARAFYAAAGFTEIDRRRAYYRDGDDALVLAREAGWGPW